MSTYTYQTRQGAEGGPRVLGVLHATPAFDMPPGACDCHVHVFGPRERYPLAEDRTFAPGQASVDDVMAMHDRIGISRLVVIQASPQGTDNRGVLAAVQELRTKGREARAVAVAPEGTRVSQLEAMHAAGVRGLRVNLQSYGKSDPASAARALRAASSMAAPLGWHVQIYTTLQVIAGVREAIRELPVPLVVDHFALASTGGGPDQPGFRDLLALVREGKVYVKLSAPYRIVRRLDGRDGGPIVRPLIEANLHRMLWGSDWPHTGPWPGQPRERDGVEPFHPIDNGAQLDLFASWTTASERRQILVDNPALLYDFPALRAHSENG